MELMLVCLRKLCRGHLSRLEETRRFHFATYSTVPRLLARLSTHKLLGFCLFGPTIMTSNAEIRVDGLSIG